MVARGSRFVRAEINPESRDCGESHKKLIDITQWVTAVKTGIANLLISEAAESRLCWSGDQHSQRRFAINLMAVTQVGASVTLKSHLTKA